MIESELTGKFTAYLRDRGFVVYKVNDHHTRGIPDLIVTSVRGTTFIEVKRIPFVVSPQQHKNMQTLWHMTGRAWFLIFDGKLTSKVYVVTPDSMRPGAGRDLLTFEEAIKEMDL